MVKTACARTVAPKIELIANICTIAAAFVFVVSIGWFFLRYNASLLNSRSSIQKGTKMMLPDVNWSTSPKTLLLVLSTDCKYCTASAPFYRRLVNNAAETANTRLIAIFPQSTNESRKYLAKQEVKIDALKQAVPASVGVRGTPTLILVDSNGVVIQSWDGMVRPDVESEVLASVK
jgi:thioredoxin-related protein